VAGEENTVAEEVQLFLDKLNKRRRECLLSLLGRDYFSPCRLSGSQRLVILRGLKVRLHSYLIFQQIELLSLYIVLRLNVALLPFKHRQIITQGPLLTWLLVVALAAM
jgi:hypothetical protein